MSAADRRGNGSAPPDSISASARDAMHEEEALGKAYDARLLRRLWTYVAPYWRLVAITLLLVGPLFVFDAAPAWIIKTGLDRVAGDGAAGEGGVAGFASRLLEAPAGIPQFLWLGALYLVVMAIRAALQFVHMLVMAYTGQHAMRDLRRDVFAHIQKLDLAFFDRYPVGRLVTRATNDVENVAEMFSAGIVAAITDLLRMAGFAILLFLVDARLALFAFLAVPVLAVVAVIFRLKVRAAYRLVRVRIARINTYIQENVAGMKVVQLFTREDRNRREFDHLNAVHRDSWLQSIRYDSALFSVVELAQGITVALIVWKATGLAEAGILYVFIDYTRLFFLPLRELSARYSVMQSSMASCERIFQLLDTEPRVKDPPQPAPARLRAAERGTVEFENVWFAYQGDDWVLRDLSFRVEAGEKVAIVGATGAGKSTIINLLTRFYDVTKGRIRLDGVDLRELRQQDLRRRVAMVLQDVFLFSGTVADNISLEREDLDLQSVRSAARAVQVDRFIEALPEGYATPIRERGTNFSGGQRQLLS
ncbi:MAG: ABC transporter ATP-binding protein/permease, partial [Myxococcales bacterium]|nr:ABC transporter ATP-binding protein/permease [Myxococcales bacterium]